MDLARGLAVLGMVAAHLRDIPRAWSWTEPATWWHIVDGRSSILFALLAGVSIGIVTGGTRPVTGSARCEARRRLAARTLALWVLGMLLILTGVPVYVILTAYAIFFALALPFLGLSVPQLLGWTLGLAVLMPFLQPFLDAAPFWRIEGGAELSAMLGWHYPFTVWIVFILAGLLLARCDVTRAATQWRMLVIGAALATSGYTLDGLIVAENPYHSAVFSAEPHSSGLLEVAGSGGFAIAMLALCLLLCRVGLLSWLSLPLRATGSMPLTAYALQLLAWALWASLALGDVSDLGGFRALDPFWPLLVAVVAFCLAWALTLGRGPLEWLVERFARFVASGPAPRGR